MKGIKIGPYEENKHNNPQVLILENKSVESSEVPNTYPILLGRIKIKMVTSRIWDKYW